MRTKIAAVICCVLMIGAGAFLLIRGKFQTVEHEQESEYLSDMYHYTNVQRTTAQEETQSSVKSDSGAKQSNIDRLYNENNEFLGWLEDETGRISTAVMYAPYADGYYLDHSFKRSKNEYGVPYVLEYCKVGAATSMAVVGHDSTFQFIKLYNDQNYHSEHPMYIFDTIYGKNSYKVAAAFSLTGGEGELVKDLVRPESSVDFKSAWSEVKSRTPYDTKVQVRDYDNVLVLVTCDQSQEDGRYAVLMVQQEDNK